MLNDGCATLCGLFLILLHFPRVSLDAVEEIRRKSSKKTNKTRGEKNNPVGSWQGTKAVIWKKAKQSKAKAIPKAMLGANDAEGGSIVTKRTKKSTYEAYCGQNWVANFACLNLGKIEFTTLVSGVRNYKLGILHAPQVQMLIAWQMSEVDCQK